MIKQSQINTTVKKEKSLSPKFKLFIDMTKDKYWKNIKSDPEKYKKYLDIRKKWYDNKKQDKVWCEKTNERKKENERKRKEKDIELFNQKSIEKTKRYNSKHPFRKISSTFNRKYVDKITAFDLWKLAKKQKMKCVITGDKLTKENISLDHIIPKCKGGKNVVENLRFVTQHVNYAKNTLSDSELLDMCLKIVKGLSNKPF